MSIPKYMIQTVKFQFLMNLFFSFPHFRRQVLECSASNRILRKLSPCFQGKKIIFNKLSQ